jgi:hypothetical protein
MSQFVRNIANHLTHDGVAFITTPNVNAFSLGHRPSPMNREHVKELTLKEFTQLLSQFRSARIWGQRFIRPELSETWRRDVEHKIELLNAGTRWVERGEPHPVLKAIHRFPPVDWAWKILRWKIVARLQNWAAARTRPYDYRDFEFVDDNFEDALWFAAIVQL